MSLLAILVLAAPFGGAGLLGRMLAATPLLALLAVTTSALGLVVGSFALTQRQEILITNLASYSLLFFCGAVAPVTAFGSIGTHLVRVLPLTNGLLAVRDAVSGRPSAGDALFELAIRGGWCLAGLALLRWHEYRARVLGTDDLL